MMYLAWIAALCVAATQGRHSSGTGNREYGRIGGQYNKDNYGSGARNAQHWNRDQQQHQGDLSRSAIWTGKAGEKDDAWRRNQQQFRDQANAKRQNYANKSNNFGNIINQIRDEGLRHAYKIQDQKKYNRNDQEQASGYNGANARKNAFDRGNNLDDNINYSFNKKFNKQSSENGGFEDENGRRFSKTDIIDEREKDQALKRDENSIRRRQKDQEQAIKEKDWRANANQAQANAGQYGFGDRRLEAAGERSDERAVDYNRKDNQYRENEKGVDLATRLAKDLAEQAAGYRNEAGALADSSRTVQDAKFYGGEQTSPSKAGVAYGHEAGINGPKSRNEGSGGRIKSGFNENADQKERGEELSRANALSAAEARNEYERLKDRVVFDEVKGLKDRSNGAFKQGLSDTANQGFNSNAAEAAKHAAEKDKSFAGASSASEFAAKQDSVNEALRDRDYYLKKQNDENETFTRRKQFFHNKKEGGSNDENLKYDRKKKAREFGAAEEADLAKQNQFSRATQDAKKTTSERGFEDSKNRRAQLQHQQEDKVSDVAGHADLEEEAAAKAGANQNFLDKSQNWQTADDSRSDEYGRKQSLWNGSSDSRSNDQNANAHKANTKGELEVLSEGGDSPFGTINSRDYVGNAFAPIDLSKKKKEHKKIPDLVIDIKPAKAPIKIEPPKRQISIPDLPAPQPVKAYHPPKYNKKKVDYNTKFEPSRSRSRDQGIYHNHGFQRIGTNLFNRSPNRFSRLNTGIQRGAATSAFKKPGLSFHNRNRNGALQLGSLTRNHRFGRR